LYPSLFRGRLFSLFMAWIISLSVMVLKSLSLGKYWRISPLVFSFNPPTFIRSIWIGKIKVTFQSVCDFLMISKLFSIIRCNRINLIRNGRQQSFYCALGVSFSSSIYLVNKGKSRLSFCHRDNGLFGAIAPATPISFKFSTYCRFVNANYFRSFRLCSSFMSVGKVRSLQQLRIFQNSSSSCT